MREKLDRGTSDRARYFQLRILSLLFSSVVCAIVLQPWHGGGVFYVRAIAVYSKLLTFYWLVSFADLTTITVVSVSLEMFFSLRREDNYVFSPWNSNVVLVSLLLIININALFLLPTLFS